MALGIPCCFLGIGSWINNGRNDTLQRVTKQPQSERLFSRTYANWASVEEELAKNDLKMLGLKLEENFFTIQEFPK
ncbi:MAG: hypothetical protein ABI370_01000 [Gammaproteobacteria bacterium]